jgi:predicted site-specific integrase-resolvase
MPSTNDHGPKRAILYARVSTDEQVRSGYSLAQQIEALRAYAAREGYEVLEEVSDPGQSGASLERPGMDRVRDLVANGDVSVVLAQDRDRISREPATPTSYSASSRSMAAHSGHRTTGERAARRGISRTASSTSSPSTSGRRSRKGPVVA